MEDIISLEKRQTDVVAKEYLMQGYEVSREVVLDFFPKLPVDLLAKKGEDIKVIEVKTRTSLARNPAITELGNLLYTKPGWTYVLHLVGEPELLYSPENACPFDTTDIDRRIEDAERLVELGFLDAAFLLAWSASESAVRILIAKEGISTIKRITSSAYTLGTAVVDGALTREDYNYLLSLMRHRNAVIHGFKGDNFDESLTLRLIETTQRLLSEIVTSEAD